MSVTIAPSSTIYFLFANNMRVVHSPPPENFQVEVQTLLSTGAVDYITQKKVKQVDFVM